MRTNIVLNPDLVREAMQYTQARTRKALVASDHLPLVADLRVWI